MSYEFLGSQDKRNIYLLFGCYCINPKLITNEKTKTVEYDYPETFHKMIWAALHNMVKKSNILNINPMDIENEISQSKKALEVWKDNDGWEYITKAIEDADGKLDNVEYYRDIVRKYSVLRSIHEHLKMDVSFIYDENDEVKLDKFNNMTSSDLISVINSKTIDFKNKWDNKFGDGYAFHISEDIRDRVKEHKEQNNTFGYPFQSGYLTTICRGLKPKKLLIRSSHTGGGKTRISLSEALNISFDKIYDWRKKKWVSTGDIKPVLYISTEMTKEEIQDIAIAHISGIEQDRIEEWREIDEETEKIIDESVSIFEKSLLFVEYMPDFTIDLINDTIEQYITNHDVEYVFFDYINDSPSLYQYYYEKTKTKLRTDQILALFSEALKLTANKYGVYIGTSTQTNDSYKDNNNKDESAIKGSKAIIQKADVGMLALPATKSDLEKLQPILNSASKGSFGINEPNMSYWIFKNRGNKYKGVVVWTRLNMGTMREMDCFVTNYNYELIADIEKTIIEFEQEDVGDVHIENDNEREFEPTDVINQLTE